MGNTLDQIALTLPVGTDKGKQGHGYLEIYERYFAPVRMQLVRVLEMGVQRGGSLALWAQYFANAVEIDGADIDISQCKLKLPPACKLWQCDQSSATSLRELATNAAPWDIIIDDASHHPTHQINAFENLWPALKPGGLYCIEDLHPNYTTYKDVHPSMVERLHDVIDDLNAHGKLGVARIGNNPQAEQDSLLIRERDVAAIHLFRYLAIIQKVA